MKGMDIMNIKLDDKEIYELLKCISARLDIIRDEVKTFKELKETDLNSEINDDTLKLSISCDKIIASYQKEYLFLHSLQVKITNSEEALEREEQSN